MALLLHVTETEGESTTFYYLLLWERAKFAKVTLQNCKFVINMVNQPWNASVLALNLLSATKGIFFDYICKQNINVNAVIWKLLLSHVICTLVIMGFMNKNIIDVQNELGIYNVFFN